MLFCLYENYGLSKVEVVYNVKFHNDKKKKKDDLYNNTDNNFNDKCYVASLVVIETKENELCGILLSITTNYIRSNHYGTA